MQKIDLNCLFPEGFDGLRPYLAQIDGKIIDIQVNMAPHYRFIHLLGELLNIGHDFLRMAIGKKNTLADQQVYFMPLPGRKPV